MAAIFIFKISQKIFKRKHYKLIVHWNSLKPILSKIETLLPKMCKQVTATAQKKAQPIKADKPNLGEDYP